MNLEAFYKITYGLYIVSSAKDNKLNGYVSNTVFQVTAEPAQFAISCSKNNFSTEMIMSSQVFAISVLNKDVKADIIGTFGYRSGKDFDKFSKYNYSIGKTGSPILMDDTIAWFECEVVQTIDCGSHILFIGNVVEADLTNAVGEPLTYAYYREVKKGKAPKNSPTYIDPEKAKQLLKASASAKYVCTACGHIYDPEIGDPASGIKPGTAFENLPDTWKCPVCGAEKADFIKQELI